MAASDFSSNFIEISTSDLPLDIRKKQVEKLILAVMRSSENPSSFKKKWALACHPDKPLRDFKYKGSLVISKQAMAIVAENLDDSNQSLSEKDKQNIFFQLISASVFNDDIHSSLSLDDTYKAILKTLANPNNLIRKFEFKFRWELKCTAYEIPEKDMVTYLLQIYLKDILYPEFIKSNHYDYASKQLKVLEKVFACEQKEMELYKTTKAQIESLNSKLGDLSNNNLLELTYNLYLAGPYAKVCKPWPVGITIQKRDGFDENWTYNIPSQELDISFSRLKEAEINIISSVANYRLRKNFGQRIQSIIRLTPLVLAGTIGAALIILLGYQISLPMVIASTTVEAGGAALIIGGLGIAGLVYGHALSRSALNFLAGFQQPSFAPPQKTWYLPGWLFEMAYKVMHPLRQIAFSPLKKEYSGFAKQALQVLYPLRLLLGLGFAASLSVSLTALYAGTVALEKAAIAYLSVPNIIYDIPSYCRSLRDKLHSVFVGGHRPDMPSQRESRLVVWKEREQFGVDLGSHTMRFTNSIPSNDPEGSHAPSEQVPNNRARHNSP